MKAPAIEEIEDFFDARGKVGYPESPWEESSLTIETEVDGDSLWFEIIPRSSHAHLRWVGKPFRVFDLHLNNITEMNIETDKESEVLIVKFKSRTTRTFKLYLKPKLCVFWGNGS